MYTLKTLNKIAPVGLLRLPGDHIQLNNDSAAPDAVLVRSVSMHDMPMADNLLCIARAGAGVNNIPVADCSTRGIVVFNTPGANANAVRELTLCALFLSSRDVFGGISWARGLSGDDVPAQVEKGKSAFAGPEILGKTLGVIGLGAIGVGVANAAHHLGMKVLGYDPYISIDAAWGLSHNVTRAIDIRQIFAESDYITIHVPYIPETKAMLADMFGQVKPGVRVINFARGELIDTDTMLAALADGTVSRYVTDFPNEKLLSSPNVVPIPHLGASTPESEDNCAVMAVSELSDYLLHGNIKNSVNFPDVDLPASAGYRVCVIHKNIPNMLSQIAASLSESGLNIENMLSKSKKEFAYTMLELTDLPGTAAIDRLRAQEGILRVRLIKM